MKTYSRVYKEYQVTTLRIQSLYMFHWLQHNELFSWIIMINIIFLNILFWWYNHQIAIFQFDAYIYLNFPLSYEYKINDKWNVGYVDFYLSLFMVD